MVRRLDEGALQQKSVAYGTLDIKNNYKNSNKTEISIVLNTGSHGYYMGYRFAEAHFFPKHWWRRLWGVMPLDDDRILVECKKAAEEYIAKKNYYKLSPQDLNLVRSSLRRGFKKGYEAGAFERLVK